MIEHINENFVGWFSFPQFYKDMISILPEGGTFIEVGVYEGKSFAYFIVEAINAGKKLTCVAVDAFPWEGLEAKFVSNMTPLKDNYVYFTAESSEATRHFPDKCVDLLFIDANHTYEFVKRDIQKWLPKMKPGSIMAGHDYGRDDYRPYQGVYDAVNEMFSGKVDEKYVKSEDVWMVKL